MKSGWAVCQHPLRNTQRFQILLGCGAGGCRCFEIRYLSGITGRDGIRSLAGSAGNQPVQDLLRQGCNKAFQRNLSSLHIRQRRGFVLYNGSLLFVGPAIPGIVTLHAYAIFGSQTDFGNIRRHQLCMPIVILCTVIHRSLNFSLGLNQCQFTVKGQTAFYLSDSCGFIHKDVGYRYRMSAVVANPENVLSCFHNESCSIHIIRSKCFGRNRNGHDLLFTGIQKLCLGKAS